MTCICNCDREEPEETLRPKEGRYYKLRDGRRALFLAENRGVYMFMTWVRTPFYDTKNLDGIIEMENRNEI